MAHQIVKTSDLYLPKLTTRYIERRVTYSVWWAGGIVLLTNNEAQARRKAREVNGIVRMVAEDRKV